MTNTLSILCLNFDINVEFFWDSMKLWNIVAMVSIVMNLTQGQDGE